jgi:hypothetical protein
MKKLILITVITFLCLLGKAQNTVHSQAIIEKAKSRVQTYIKSEALYPKSYLPVNWSDMWVINKRGKNDLLERTNDTIINIKIDSLIALENESPKYEHIGTVYTLLHAFKVRTPSKQLVLKVYTFHLDNNMDILDVDKGTPEEQLENIKGFIAQEQKKKQLIAEIGQMKIEDIEKKPK